MLLPKFDHHIWDFDVLPCLILGRDFKDDIFLMVGNRFA